ncbi:TetR family transcriptional regulator [Actibacterium sp. D379-3]
MARKTGSHSEITGPLVRAAAQRLFAQHGYGAVSMRQIAAEVGVQAGALYNYIPDKQSLLFDMMKAHLEAVLAAWAAEPEGATPVDRLAAFTRFHITFHLDRPDAVLIVQMEQRNLTPENAAAVGALRTAYEAQLETILRDGKTAGDFTLPDTRLAALGVLALLTGVTTGYREEGRVPRDRVVRIYWNMVRKAVGA